MGVCCVYECIYCEACQHLLLFFLQVVNCLIQQKVGAGLHYDCVTHWDSKHDSAITVKFENDNLTCIVMIFGISI